MTQSSTELSSTQPHQYETLPQSNNILQVLEARIATSELPMSARECGPVEVPNVSYTYFTEREPSVDLSDPRTFQNVQRNSIEQSARKAQ
jgi:hypothetical protein